MIDCRFRAIVVAGRVFKLPCVLAFVVLQTGVVIAFVEVFEDGGEDLGGLLGKVDAVRGRFEELAAGDGGEEGRGREDGGVGGKEALFGADAKGYDGGGEVAVERNESARVRGCLQWM